MFDSLALENPKQKWATLMSFTLEAAFLGTLIAAPLAFTEKLQLSRFHETIVAPTNSPSEPAPPPRDNNTVNSNNRSEMNANQTLIVPTEIPDRAQRIVDTEVVSPPVISDGVQGAFLPGPGTANSTMRRIFDGMRTRDVVTTAPISHGPILISHLDAGFLIHRVQPIYPHNAMITRTEGVVILSAVIDTSGRITQLRAVSGHPLLIQAALDAVRQWRYKPYILNGAPVEVETQVSVFFNLNSR